MFWHRRSRVALTFVCALALILSFAGSAVAYDKPLAWDNISNWPESGLGFSSTNPGSVLDAEAWWRDFWGNSTSASYELEIPAGCVPEHFSDGQRNYDPGTGLPVEPIVLGAIYVVDKSPDTDINENAPALYEHATGLWTPQNLLILKADMLSTAAGSPTLPNARFPWEGEWFLHYSFYSESDVSTLTITVPLNVDVTPPAPVRKVVARPSAKYSGATGGWFESNRAHVTWEDMEYDAMSGIAYYKIVVNGEEFDQRVWHLGHTSTSISVEDLPPGENVIEIIPIDRATNEGPAEKVTFKSDPDYPVVKITTPSAEGQTLPVKPTFAADVTDGAGIQWVDFAIDGKSIYTDLEAPYAVTWNMASYSTGPHTLTVRAKDMYGHVTEAKRTFYVDKTIPIVSSLSDAPDPFYPVLKDGYKDAMTVNFFTSEGGKCALYVYDSAGNLWAKRTKRCIGSGWQSMSWDGVGGEDEVKVGTFTYKIEVRDAAGNPGYSATGYTTIRDYEIVRVAPNAVQIVPR